ncbi:MAG TPA: tRNA pseudouridine(55) synthase TruB [Clostridia bacterium]|nr:tRNA pseudouridine(55) synthase TruB [Clostridia bacterium]
MEVNGLLVIDKPAGMTSHDVVARIRRTLGERSVGHLGTLDPMATGVLPLVLGRMTRIAQFYGDSVKEYEGEIRFGYATTTYDAEGERIDESGLRPASELTDAEVAAAAAKFAGELQQVPPPFSAKKIGGVPAYKLARKDKPVELNPVTVRVERFEIAGIRGDSARFHASVSAGTYIRSLAHDLGKALGTGAHLASLRRTRSGEFTLEDARTMEQVEGSAAEPSALMVHPRRVLSTMPGVTATPEAIQYIRNGRAVNLPEMSKAKFVKVYMSQRELLAICQRIAGTLFQPKVVLYGSNEPAP